MSNLKVNTINDASGGSSAVLYGVASPPNSMGFRNRIINGEMRIDQRNGGASVTPTTNSSYQSCDRWMSTLSVASKFSLQQNAGSVTPPAGFSNYLGVTSLAATSLGATDLYAISQQIEGYNIADLGWGTASAQSVTLSFWVRSSLTGTFGGAINNSGSTRSYPFSYTISAANTWERKTVTIAGETTGTWLTNNGIGMYVVLSLGCGTTRSGTAGAWNSNWNFSATGATSVVGTSGATFYITGIQLEAGTVASSFERRDYGRELMMCQRYYQRFGGASYAGLATASMFSTTGGNFSLQYFTPMRATPTFVMTNVIVTDRTVFDTNISVAASDSGPSNAWIRFTATTATPIGAGAAYLIAVKNGTTGSISATAEL